jgi:uncharacterized protein YbcC (UPF0753/DUF2309 family)
MSTPATLRAAGRAHSLRAPAADLQLEHLRQVIDHASHLLPAQGPITVFIHHNTLHAFEHLPFTEAVKRASRIFGCAPYLPESRYREELGRGRIRFNELETVVREDLGEHADEKVLPNCTRKQLRLGMLQYPLRHGPKAELLWFMAETDALRRVRSDVSAATRGRLVAETRHWVMRELRGIGENGNGAPAEPRRDTAHLTALINRFGDASIEHWGEDFWEAFALQALWLVACNRVGEQPDSWQPIRPAVRHRDLLLQATGVDSDLLVHDVLIRFCSAFLDQGLAHWRLPDRDEGFYESFIALYREPLGPPNPWMRGLATELTRLQELQIGPLESLRESLAQLGVAEVEWDDYLSATLLALRGWGGMTRFLEERPDRAVHPIPSGSVAEFLAIRLLLERLAVAHAAREALGYTTKLNELREELRLHIPPPQPPSVEQRAFAIFQMAQVLGWTPQELHCLDSTHWSLLLAEVEGFSSVERQRVFHLAYERRFTCQTLDALAIHNRTAHPEPTSPRFQAMFCLDEREESVRRHIEERSPDCATFSIAGFYFVSMYYRGVDDAHFVPLCPAVMQPKHWVTEKVADEQEGKLNRRAKVRRAWGKATHSAHVGSRTFASGALLSGFVGVLASIPLIARTLFPRLTAQLRKSFGTIVLDPPPTQLQLLRSSSTSGEKNGQIGFSLDEMTDIAERVLRDTGLTSNFAPLVLTLGHGSTSMNNPHESAHDCGACGGSRGGPSGRAIAQVLNDHRVREQLQARGISVPAETAFVGGMHNTSSEAFTFFDLDRLKPSQRALFDQVRSEIEQAGDRDAHERCRRFGSAPLTLSPAGARQHVEGRAEDLAQVRPEWGHATNAICIVGRRQRTRGLFLDRRAFLNSYDPTQDDAQATILARILAAAVPVCAGISLEYYFSYVDNTGYGSGTKLPHNVTSLLGVMDGAASDLRTGLPWQMVEIHEPVRILFVIETTPAAMRSVIGRNPAIAQLVEKEWVQLATLDPHSPTIHVYRGGEFQEYTPGADQLPWAATSAQWYRGWRDHLEFAQIG